MGFALIVGAGIFLYYLILPRLHEFSLIIHYGLLSVVGLGYLVLGGGLLLITLTSLTGIDLLYPHNKPSITVNFLFPIATALAQLLRIDRNRLRASFVKVHNSLTIAQSRRIKGDRILILLPHCIQVEVCNRKITSDIENCARCGRCSVGLFRELGDKYRIKIEVVNGGTSARRKVKSFRPDGIVAVACERDLTLGIQDVYPIPVYGVINDRPNGPCIDTCVDMTLVEEAICFFLNLPHTRRSPTAHSWIFRSSLYHHIWRVWPWSAIRKQETRNIQALLKRLPPVVSVLDVGCGIGNSRELFPTISRYIGLDACLSAVQEASRQGTTIAQSHGDQLPIKASSVDVVLSIGLMEYMHDASRFFRSLSEPLHPGGHVLLTSSPRSVLTTCRKLLMSSIKDYPAARVIAMAREQGLELVDNMSSLLQDQFLFRKPLSGR